MTRRVDYVIIGAGMAGTVLRRFLRSDSVALLDPRPGGYKVGESIIPEHFHHPVLAETMPEVCKLPSYSPKRGTVFVGPDSVASFPLPPSGLERSAHVAREELEPLMHRLWDTPIIRERVVSTDPENHVVTTDRETYEVTHQIIDCSGPAMVIARQHGEVRDLWPTYCRWTYFDITGIDDARFRAQADAQGKRYLRFDAPNSRYLPGPEDEDWSPSQVTILTEVEPGTWTWQIPLFDRSLLSFGVVSMNGKLDDATLFDLAERTHAPQYTLRRRPLDKSSSWNRVHARNFFARTAATAATMDYILVGDAHAFADPLYSVGTGLAVNKAIEVAALLNDGGWSEEKRDRYAADCARLTERSIEAFECWYSGDLLRSDEAADNVQRNFLQGTAFQVGIATAYGKMLLDASPEVGEDGASRVGRFGLDGDAEPVTDEVSHLIGLCESRSLMDWTLAGAFATGQGLHLLWDHEDKPRMTVIFRFSPEATQYYRRVDDISMAFMNLFDGPYPFDDDARVLFDRLEERVAAAPEAWRAVQDQAAA